MQPVNQFISISAFLLFGSQLLFAINFIMSWFNGEKAPMNPWLDNGLEWTVSSPPPHGNFGSAVPTVYRGPYEYSSPHSDQDYIPQNMPMPGGMGTAHPQHAGD
jgi:cytochrome c oxidase subunit 1